MNRRLIIFVFVLFALGLMAFLPSPAIKISSPAATPCNLATFVKDITYPDNGVGKGSIVKAGTQFRKTWLIKNVGTCTWNSDYKWAFDYGHLMSAQSPQILTSGKIRPGQTLEVSVDLIAPNEPGIYTGYWRLMDSQGRTFGTTLDKPFYVTIKVSPSYISSTSSNVVIPSNQTNRTIYYPFRDCAPSRLYKGDTVFVSYGGGPNGIRSAPDVHPNNIFYRAPEGEWMQILEGPKCSWGWLIWKVKTETGYTGWTPESDGKEFWLIPIDSAQVLPTALKNDPKINLVYQQASKIFQDRTLSETDRREKIRVLQNKYGEELVATVIRYVPVYDFETGKILSFDTYMRTFVSQSGHSTYNAPIETDPIGAGLSVFFNPSSSNIKKMLGLP
jgi:hypothetical protein